jgi:phospholipid/cholesterol/gamma-HCH transport system substrate-binding protein
VAANEKAVELKVGIFVLVGLAVLAALVVQFGRVGEGFKRYYTLTVVFPDASGLLKGSDVLMSGAKIGFVSGGPRLVKNGEGVEVPLRVFDFVKIPTGSRFTVGASGLLGDRFVAVSMPQGKPESYFSPNATVTGTRETGLDDLTKQGSALVGDLRTTVQNINTTVTRLNEQAFSQPNMENLKATMQHLNEATSSFADTSKKLDGVVEKADATMASAKSAADNVQVAVFDARRMFGEVTNFVQQATRGKGLLPQMISNSDLANDLRALISNLRAHGILFYRDSAAKAEREPNPPRKPATR